MKNNVEKKLIGNPNAKIWAEEFVKIIEKKPSIAKDEATMIGWFANAIMAGYDLGMKHQESIYKRKENANTKTEKK